MLRNSNLRRSPKTTTSPTIEMEFVDVIGGGDEEMWVEEEEDEEGEEETASSRTRSCSKGHRPSLALETAEGGSICLACLADLLFNPRSLSHHVSYAISQLAAALRTPGFARALGDRHAHFLVAPLVSALASFDDEPLARQMIDLITDLSGSPDLPRSVLGDFVARIADILSSGELAWSQRQVFMLHCLGVLLNSNQDGNPAALVRKKTALFSTLVVGLQLPSEEIRGEILFVLYKMCLQQATPWDDDSNLDYCDLSSKGEFLLYHTLEALLKTQNDDVRMNCIANMHIYSPALLTVLARRGVFENWFESEQAGSSLEANKSMQEEDMTEESSLVHMFAEAIKGPLLSSDIELQISTLDLIFQFLGSDIDSLDQVHALIEEGIVDYVFEVLRLSGNKDAVLILCLKVLDHLSLDEREFSAKLVIGFPTLVSVLQYVAEMPLHPAQSHTLKLVSMCARNFPGTLSASQVEEIAVILTGSFTRHSSGNLEIFSDTFTLACSTFVELLKSPSAHHSQKLTLMILEASRSVLSFSLSCNEDMTDLLLYSLCLIKEVCLNDFGECSTTSINQELAKKTLETCEIYLLPWLERVIDEGEGEQVALCILEIFHLLLLKRSKLQAGKFADILAVSSCFSISFGCLGLFPTDSIKTRVYLMLISLIDILIGIKFGEPVRDSYTYLPSDPRELMNLLGLNSLQDEQLASCQDAVIVILYVSSLYGERLSEPHEVLASLEQYILVNYDRAAGSMLLPQLVHVYALVRDDASKYSRSPYSAEAEKAAFHLISEKEWDLFSLGIHPAAIKWIFKQEELRVPLTYQILNFCKVFCNKTQLYMQASSIRTLDIQMIAELAAHGDNFVALLLVILLKGPEESREEDILCVINVVIEILSIFHEASDQFSINGIAGAVRRVYYLAQSTEMTKGCLLLIFNVLYFADYTTFTQDAEWLAIVIKLLESVNIRSSSCSFGQEEHLILAIFCLILYNASNGVLKEASKAILMNKALSSAIEDMVQRACEKGPALAGHNEGTPMGESLTFILLLNFFFLKSFRFIFQENIDWHNYIHLSDKAHLSPVLCIKCHDICRLMYFGPSIIKQVCSQCLVELLTRISYHRESRTEEQICSARYLKSLIAVIEGLLFFGDSRVATNCSICFSIILGWEKCKLLEENVIKNSNWCRVVIEEFTMTLAASGFTSISFRKQHQSLARVALALLKLETEPVWMKSVFSSSCISGILSNLSACNMTAETVKLFRELMMKKYLNEEQINSLHQLLQICRKKIYTNGFQEQVKEEKTNKVLKDFDNKGELCSLLIQLMLSSNMYCHDMQSENEKFIHEIDAFSTAK